MDTTYKKALQKFLAHNGALERYERNLYNDGTDKYSPISWAFAWDITPEGHEYWANLAHKWTNQREKFLKIANNPLYFDV